MNKERAAAPLTPVKGVIYSRAQKLDEVMFNTYYWKGTRLSDSVMPNELSNLKKMLIQELTRSNHDE